MPPPTQTATTPCPLDKSRHQESGFLWGFAWLSASTTSIRLVSFMVGKSKADDVDLASSLVDCGFQKYGANGCNGTGRHSHLPQADEGGTSKGGQMPRSRPTPPRKNPDQGCRTWTHSKLDPRSPTSFHTYKCDEQLMKKIIADHGTCTVRHRVFISRTTSPALLISACPARPPRAHQPRRHRCRLR